MISSILGNLPAVRSRALIYWLIILAGLIFGGWLDLLDWHSSANLHTGLEALTTATAFAVFYFTLARYRKKGDLSLLFISMAFLAAGALDLFHTVVTAPVFTSLLPIDQPALNLWSWTAPQLILSVLLLWSCVAGRNPRSNEQAYSTNPYLVTGGVLSGTVLTIIFLTFYPLPDRQPSGIVFQQPQELVPAIFFALTIIGYLRKGTWRHNTFEHWLMLALILNLVCQTLIMPMSMSLFDSQFNVAHILKVTSHLCVLVGCLQRPLATNIASDVIPDEMETVLAHKEGIFMSLGIGSKLAILCGLVALLAAAPVAIQSSRSWHDVLLKNGLKNLSREAGTTRYLLHAMTRQAEDDLLSMPILLPGTHQYNTQPYQVNNAQEDLHPGQLNARLVQRMHRLMEANSHYLEFSYHDFESGKVLVQLVQNSGQIDDLAIDGAGSELHQAPPPPNHKTNPDQPYWSNVRWYRSNNDRTTSSSPRLNVTLPVYSEDGIGIGTFSLSIKLDRILLTPPTDRIGTHWYVSSTNGEFVVHPDQDKEFSFGSETSYSLDDEFPGLSKQLKKLNTVKTGLLNHDVNGIEQALGIYQAGPGQDTTSGSLLVPRQPMLDRIA
ncbi:MAG: MASE3 domain-containing protein [Gammaproteobacteria bacterium]|nr:MASE3 domain-containing protein [Gammaproteobacteria bacterium]